jgi:hypothetical protein
MVTLDAMRACWQPAAVLMCNSLATGNDCNSRSATCAAGSYGLQALRDQILAKHPNKKFATDSDCEV